jgi:gas vesicle protein
MFSWMGFTAWHDILIVSGKERSSKPLKNNAMNKILVGFTAGLLVGLLFAPAKGSETRESISSKGRDLKNKFNDLVDAVTDKFDSLTDDVEDYVHEERQAAKSFKNEMI